jgi:hypothetical protein
MNVVVIWEGVNLGLPLQPTKCAREDDAVVVPLEFGSFVVGLV